MDPIVLRGVPSAVFGDLVSLCMSAAVCPDCLTKVGDTAVTFAPVSGKASTWIGFPFGPVIVTSIVSNGFVEVFDRLMELMPIVLASAALMSAVLRHTTS
ncbi:MAG: hypothetical protein ACOYB2_19960 [Limnohabitans sp.]